MRAHRNFAKFRTTLVAAGSTLVLMFSACVDEKSDNAGYAPGEIRTEKTKTATQGSQENWSITNPTELVTKVIEFQPTGDRERAGQFKDLDPEETGIDLKHIWDPPLIHRSLVSQIFGSGVAIGDYNNDGLSDVYVARQTDAGRLYKNLGGMKFEDVTALVGIDPSGMWTFGTTFVDINNDGLLDLYLCGQDCPNRLYINNGSGFDEQAAKYGLDFHGASIEMTFADYDLDGDLDAYLVTNHLNRRKPGPRNEAMVIRRGNQEPEVRPAYREFVYLLKHPDGSYKRIRAGQHDHFFRNDNGKFVDATEESGIGLHPYIGLSANWWDYNEDGRPDLYVANDYKGPDFLYRNNGPDANGNVTFTNVIAESIPHTPWFSMGSDFGDINNDGRLDYASADMAGTSHYRDKLSMGNMSGPNSQGWYLNVPTPPQYMRNAVYLNTGTERFMEIANLTGLAKTDWTWTTKFADFDNDGWQDVYFTNGMMRDVLNSDHLASQKLVRQQHLNSGDKSKTMADVLWDFWHAKEPFRLENMCFQNQGDLNFKNVASKWGLDHLGVSTGAGVGDLDNDGDLDLVITGFEERVRVYRNDMANQNSIRFQLTGTRSNRGAHGARIEIQTGDDGESSMQTRYVSSSRGFMSTSENIVHFGVGELEKINKAIIHWPSGISQQLDNLTTNALYRVIEPGDQTSLADNKQEEDTKTTFQPFHSELDKIQHREKEFDDFQRQPLLPNKYSQLGPALAWGDIDGDGDDDVFIGAAAADVGTMMENRGNGSFRKLIQPGFLDDIESEDMGSLFFDADRDGDLDLYVVSGGVECEPGDEVLMDRLYLNDGNGLFSKSDQWLPEIYESGGCVTACDFDQDGDLDLVVGGRIVPGAYPESPKSYLLRNTGEKFEDATEQVAPQIAAAGMITSAIWSDVDGDNWTDLLLATEWGPIRFFKNNSGKLTDETDVVGLGSRLGWYNSITGGDIDNDGDTDFVVGNCGLNTKYKATVEKPELLYYGDFEGVGRKRIVEAKYENGVCLPRRGLSCSSHAMPMVKEKTPTFHEFAISSLDAIYTTEKLDDATKFEANSLESGVLVNESNDSGIKFSFRPLPRIAQASPVFGCQLCDVDGDGNLDLYVVQNFYGPQPETGYFDGGISLLLSGNGKGEFTAVDPASSGLVVTGDAKSLTITDLNNDDKPDFVVGRNNSNLVAFENALDEDNIYTLRLNEINDGRDYVNAKVVAEYSDGTKQLHEVRSADGFMSQSSAIVFLGRGSGKSLTKINIRWPDGSTTDHEVTVKTSTAKSN